MVSSAHNCGEIPLFPGEPCDLGAINLAQYVETPDRGLDGFDWASFREDTATCIRFLDNVLEVNRFALEDNRDMSMKLRRLGLGIMGLADALIKMGLRYDAPEGRAAVEAMIDVLREGATAASQELAEERGPFPMFGESDLETPRRNVALLTVAPTGTTSMLMGVSSGVEPIFAPFIYRKIGDSYAALVSPLFREMLEQHPPHPDCTKDGAWDWDKVVEAVQNNHGSVQGIAFIPDAVQARAGLRSRHRPGRACADAGYGAERLRRGRRAGRQQHLQNHQHAQPRNRRRRVQRLRPGVRDGLQGHHRLPRRQQAVPGAVNQKERQEGDERPRKKPRRRHRPRGRPNPLRSRCPARFATAASASPANRSSTGPDAWWALPTA